MADRIDAVQAAREAADFAGWAWRDAWCVQAVVALGLGMMFTAVVGELTTTDAGDLWAVGAAVALVAAAPLFGALYRLKLGGAALRGLGPLGMQFGWTEVRLWALALGGGFATLLLWLPVVAVSALVFLLFRPFGMVAVEGMGDWRVSFLLVGLVWAAAFTLYLWAVARLSLAPIATTGKRRLVLLEAWELTRGHAAALILALGLVQLPLLLALLGVGLVGGPALTDPLPPPLAAAAGLAFGLMIAFLSAPLTVGVLGAVYADQRAERTRRTQPPPRLRLAEPFARRHAMASAR